jgi:exonuclease III
VHDDFILWLRVQTKTISFALGIVYFAPEGSSCNAQREDYFDILLDDIRELKDQFPIMIIGDFNSRTNSISDICYEVEGSEAPNQAVGQVQVEERDSFPEHLSVERASEDSASSNVYGRKLIELCRTSGLRMLNGRLGDTEGRYTRVGTTGKSVIDYCLVDSKAATMVTNFPVKSSIPESDHRPLLVTLVMLDRPNSKPDLGEKLLKYKWNITCVNKFHQALLSAESQNLKNRMYSSILRNCEVNLASDIWLDYFAHSLDQVSVKKACGNFKPNIAPWMDEECKVFRKGLLLNDDTYVDNLVTYKALIQRKNRDYKRTVLEKLESQCKCKPLEFWQTLNSLPSAAKSSHTSLEPEDICNQIKEMSSIPHQGYFDDNFEKQVRDFINLYDSSDYDACVNDPEMSSVLNANIDVTEVESAVKKLKKGKSSGLDGIPVEYVKASIDIIKDDLTSLFNYILSKEVYPYSWCEGLRVAIPKGDSDIRPITIEPVFSKVFETIIDNRIAFINEAYSKGDKYNGGFVKGSMTQDNVLIINACIQKQLALGKCLYVAMVDFKKAFNFVNHSILFYKILKSGLTGRCIKLLQNMYKKIKARVKVNNLLYEWIKDMSGTNQGGPLSPNMFRYMLSDLVSYLSKAHGIVLDDEAIAHLLWADDLVLLSDSPEGLQQQLDGLFLFCKRFQMIVNETKTKVMIFGKQGDQVFIFNDKKLEIVNEYKYLGVVINSIQHVKGNIFKNMIKYTSNKAYKASFSISKKCKSAGYLTPRIGFYLFDTYVLPVLTYASEIWCNIAEIPNIESVQLKFLKFILGVKPSTSNLAVLGEMGRFPIVILQHVKLFKYWLRLVQLDNDKLVKKAFNVLYQLHRCGFYSWASKIFKLLEFYNLEYVWDDFEFLSSMDFPTLIRYFKSKTLDNYVSDWKKRVKDFPILRSYLLFKNHFSMEPYLYNVKDFKLRRCLSKFRLSSHCLAVEKGRHQRPKVPEKDRTCIYCKGNNIENEIHMLIDCPFYLNERIHLLSVILVKYKDLFGNATSSVEAFTKIMSCEDVNVCFHLAKFIEKCFKKRSS